MEVVVATGDHKSRRMSISGRLRVLELARFLMCHRRPPPLEWQLMDAYRYDMPVAILICSSEVCSAKEAQGLAIKSVAKLREDQGIPFMFAVGHDHYGEDGYSAGIEDSDPNAI